MSSDERISTGIDGLDTILQGGIFPRKNYLVRGGPGTGKTTFGLHFLTADDAGEALYITLDQTEEEIRNDAEEMGFDLGNVTFLDLSPQPDFFSENEQYDVFESSDVEWGPVTERIIEAVNERDPGRVFIDSLTQFRHLSPDVYQFRKQALSFSRYLVDEGATVLMVSEEHGENDEDRDLQFLSDSVITLRNDDNRYLEVEKFRGSDHESGEHHVRITDEGFQVFSRTLPEVDAGSFRPGDRQYSSGIEELDDMIGGGIEDSTVTMLTGPSGVGKTTTGLQIMTEAAKNDDNGVLYSFEEYPEKIFRRMDSLGISTREQVESSNLEVNFVRPDRYTSREFLHRVKEDVRENDYSMVMIDSLTGWGSAVENDSIDSLIRELTTFLTRQGITVILVNEIKNITGQFTVTEEHISHLMDNVIYLRYVEFGGRLRKIIGVLKKRMSNFQRRIREIELGEDGIQVGESLQHLHGLLDGTPRNVEEDGEVNHSKTINSLE